MTSSFSPVPEATFIDRLKNFIEITNPFYLIYGHDDVEWAKRTQRSEDRYTAERILRVASHPDLCETIPRPFRIGAAIPMNILISTAMVHPAVMLSVTRSAAVHWLNQSYNCAVNFANRNASSEVSTSVLAQTYIAACAFSVSIALSATLILKRYALSGWKLIAVRGIFPMVAASTASVVNVAMIRRAEWLDHGVNVYDETGELRGHSLIAGTDAIRKCGITRALSNIPIVTVPVFLAAALTRYGVFRPSARLDLSCVLFGVSCGVPLCLALFPQWETISANQLEKQFQKLFEKDGITPVSYMRYNKGL